MGITSIEWTRTYNSDGTFTHGATWTPIRARRKDDGKVGVHCERVSAGCQNCYSATFNRRRLPNQGTGLDFTVPNRELVEIFLDEKILTDPLRWKKPRKIFVCSQTDLFAEFVPDEFIDKVFGVIALCPQHTFLILTKRAERMRTYIDRFHGSVSVDEHRQLQSHAHPRNDNYLASFLTWPFPHVWLGVSAENQPTADARVIQLLRTQAAKRFVSYEPALTAIDFSGYLMPPARLPGQHKMLSPAEWIVDVNGAHIMWRGIDWVISGCESGPRRRPSEIEWFLSVDEQCRAAGVAHFHKQRYVDDNLVSLPELGGQQRVEFPK